MNMKIPVSIDAIVCGLLVAAQAWPAASAAGTAQREQARPTDAGRPNLVVSLGPTDITRLRVEVRGPGLGDGLREELTASKGELFGGIRVSPGERREFVLTALDEQGKETHRGFARRQVPKGPSQSFPLVLQPLLGANPSTRK